MLVLLAIAVLVIGLVLRLNPLAVVLASGATAGMAAGLDPVAVLEKFGHAFNANKYVTAVFLVVPMIGMLEDHGLQERAAQLILRFRNVTLGRLLLLYMLFRQAVSAVGLTQLGGHPTMVRPMLAPMAEAAAERDGSKLSDDEVKALSAATDNIGLFFGEDIFLAIGSILLMKGILDGYGIAVEPLELSLWAIPTAIAALIIHGIRLLLLDRHRKKAGHPSGRQSEEAAE